MHASFLRTCQRLLKRLPARPRSHRSRPGLEYLEDRNLLSFSTGTWTQLTNTDPQGGGLMLQLPNGNVMVQGGSPGGGTTNTWEQLAPDSTGSYLNGTFSALKSMHTPRLYYGSNVLANGNVFVIGGEYTNAGQVWTNTAELYNTVHNTWKNIATFPQSQYGDDPSEVLPNGQVLIGYLSGDQTYFYNVASNTYTPAAQKLRMDQSDEETWVKLPNGNILSYDVWSSINTGMSTAQQYVPSLNKWEDAGSVPTMLSSSADGEELGPALLLPSGQVLQIGCNGNSAIYTSGATPTDPGSWSLGPTLPNGFGSDDAPGAILPDSNIFFAADKPLFNAPTQLFDYDPSTNSVTTVSTPAALTNELNSEACYSTRMLMLPTGQLLLATGNNDLWAYTPNGSASASWQPTVSSVTYNGNFVFTLKGKQLNGMSEGASYGDDAEMSENYPIVRLVDASGGHTYYARTYNWSNVGVQTGTKTVSTKFELPAGMPAGTYSLFVSASGISSNPFTITITGGEVPPGAPPSVVGILPLGGGSTSSSLTPATGSTPVSLVRSQGPEAPAPVASPSATQTQGAGRVDAVPHSPGSDVSSGLGVSTTRGEPVTLGTADTQALDALFAGESIDRLFV